MTLLAVSVHDEFDPLADALTSGVGFVFAMRLTVVARAEVVAHGRLNDVETLEELARAEWLAFASQERYLRGLREQQLLLRRRRPGPAPRVDRQRRPRLARRREPRRRTTSDG